MFDQESIATDIKDYCRTVFREENLSFSETDIEEAILIFFNMNKMNTSHPLLNGFQRSIEDVLTKCCITEQGRYNPLKAMSTALDPFMKRVLFFSDMAHYNNYRDLTAKPLIALLGYFGNFDNYKNEAVQQSWKGNGSGAYTLAKAISSRNTETHNSPDWDKATVFEYLKYTLVSYILIILKAKADLLSHTPELGDPSYGKAVLDNRDLQAFDFLNYSRVSRNLKNQIIECFILRTLHQDGPLDESQIIEKVKTFTATSNKDIVPPRIKKLLRSDFIKLEPTGKYSLTERERERLTQSEINCSSNKQNFLLRLSAILEEDGISEYTMNVYEEFISFLKTRYLQTTQTVIEEAESTISDNSFIYWLIESTGNEEKAKCIYRQIIEECKHNDIAYRFSIGSVISSLTDYKEDIFSIHRMTRSIYLDTQIVLAMLCLSCDGFEDGDLINVKNASAIRDIGKGSNIKLLFCRTYIPEVIGHITRAIGLSYWEKSSAFDSGHFSSNVFYQHYVALKRLNTLPQGIDSFRDYLSTIFYMEPEDFANNQTGFIQNTLGIVVGDILKGMQVSYQEMPQYNHDELKNSQTIFEDVLDSSRTTKTHNSLRRDAIVGKYLFDCKETPRPFFITLDSTFAKYREKYASTYFRTQSYFWQLFSPMKFLNTHNMLGMKVNKNLLSEELLLLIEDEHTRSNAKLFMDVNLNLTDIEGISEVQKRARQRSNIKIFSGKEFADLSEGDLDLMNEMATDINRTWDLIASRFSNPQKDNLSFYQVLAQDESYDKIIEEIKIYIENHKYNTDGLLDKVAAIITSAKPLSESIEDVQDKK